MLSYYVHNITYEKTSDKFPRGHQNETYSIITKVIGMKFNCGCSLQNIIFLFCYFGVWGQFTLQYVGLYHSLDIPLLISQLTSNYLA